MYSLVSFSNSIFQSHLPMFPFTSFTSNFIIVNNQRLTLKLLPVCFSILTLLFVPVRIAPNLLAKIATRLPDLEPSPEVSCPSGRSRFARAQRPSPDDPCEQNQRPEKDEMELWISVEWFQNLVNSQIIKHRKVMTSLPLP